MATDKNKSDVGRAAPKARVLMYIKDVLAGSEERKRVFVELKGFKQVTTNLTMTGTGTATIVLSNQKSSLMRYVSNDSIKNDSKDSDYGGRTNSAGFTSQMGYDFFNKVMEDEKGVFKSLWANIVTQRGDKPIGVNTKPDKVNITQYSRSRADLMSKETDKTKIPFLKEPMRNTKDTIKEEGLIYVLPFIDLFDPIYVDYLGQDGFWYAGFTGLVTRLNESYNYMGQQSFAIQCKDYTCLLDNNSLVSSWNRFAGVEDKLSRFVSATEFNESAAKSSIKDYFSTFTTVRQIILEIVKAAQGMWTLDKLREGSNPKSLDSVGVSRIRYNTEGVVKYDGLSGRRGGIVENGTVRWKKDESDTGQFYGEISIKPKDFTRKYDLTEAHYAADKFILIDPLLFDMDNIFIQKLFNSTLSLYNDTLKSADSILNDLAARMLAYKYQDANGNIIFELPRYNALPNLIDYDGRSTATVLRHDVVDSPNSNQPIIIVPKETDDLGAVDGMATWSYTGLVDKNLERSWHTMLFHGIGYVQSSDDFISFSTSYDEATLYTVAGIRSVPQWLANLDKNLEQSVPAFYGVSTSDFELLSKLGVRRYQITNIYTENFAKPEKMAQFLSYQGAAILERVNAAADSGSIQLQQRPDLQLGRNFVLPLRWKSYLITGVSNTWSPGGQHVTTLNVTYGHPIHRTLESPWAAVRAEGSDKMFFGDINNLKKLRIFSPSSGKPEGSKNKKNASVTECNPAEDS